MSESHNGVTRGLFSRIQKPHQYFLEQKQPFHQKRALNGKRMNWFIGLVVLTTVIGVIALGGNAEKIERSEQTKETAKAAEAAHMHELTGAAHPGKDGIDGAVSWNRQSSGHNLAGAGAYHSSQTGSSRQYGASQLVKATGTGNGFGLPMGSTIAAKLVNTLLSTDSAQPVIAEITEDAVWRGSVLIPAGTKAIGGTSFDDTAKRLQIRFSTLVYPEGDQHSISAIGLLPDGSSGLPGDYHSGTAQKEIGRFLGDFVGGLTSGMQDRQSAGELGITFAPGSLRNGVLNGLSTSALDEAKSASDSMKTVHPYLEVPGGAAFVLYFEKEYSP